jgi:RNA polymerase primary sigma factor
MIGSQTIRGPMPDYFCTRPARAGGVALEEEARPRRLEPGEEAALTRRVRAGDERARARMIEANQALVFSVARKFQCASMELDDLVQEGVIGLAQAVDRFDPGRGLRFSTYAVHWIRQSITRAIDNKARMIRVPVNAGYSALRAERARQELTEELGRPPTVAEIAAQTGEPARRVGRLLDSLCETVSLEGFGEAVPREVPDHRTPSPEAAALARAERISVRELVAELPERERHVIRRRFGLDGEDAWTLQQLAGKLEITPQAVRRIEVRALKRLQSALQAMR